MRIGQGYDVHALVKGRPLIIGGVEIAYEYGLQGHSDADVLLHAIMDGVDSRKLLRQVAMLMASRGYQVGNIDATIIAQQPRMAEHLGAMCDNIASDLATHKNLINVKATTTEKLGYEGKGLGIAAQAVCLLSNS